MATAERAYRALFADLAAGIAADITRAADADGVVPRSATLDLQRRANDRVQALFLGRNRAGELAPFELLANGRLLPLSPYMRVLWQSITGAVRIPVEQNATMLAKRLPADVLAVMRRGTVDPFAEARAMVREVEVFRPNPLAQYEAPHTWVDPNGYRLSDRVWNTSAHTRRQIDLYLETAIREGRGALQMSRELERFLDPSRANLRTSAPYGKTASYDAMRLARTEISRAHQEASRTAAAMNPFVQGMKWNLSPSHPRPDICDSLARGGPNSDGVYPIESYPGRPHPQCLCFSTYATTADPDAVIDALRADIRRARRELVDKIGPVQVEAFDRLLLGETLPASGTIIPRQLGSVVVYAPLDDAQAAYKQATRDLLAYANNNPRATEKNDPVLAGLVKAQRDAKKRMEDLGKGITPPPPLVAPPALTPAPAPQSEPPARQAAAPGEITAAEARKRLADLASQDVAKQRAVVEVANPGTHTIKLAGIQANEMADEFKAGMDAFNKLVSRDAWAKAELWGKAIIDLDGRAYHVAGTINVSPGTPVVAFVHEIGHAFEQQSGVYPKVKAFYDRRTAGDALEPLSVLTGERGYGADEVARRDRWLHVYMGKEYSGATEIVSMGLEYMYSAPARFARDDPDMFDFIFNLVRGR